MHEEVEFTETFVFCARVRPAGMAIIQLTDSRSAFLPALSEQNRRARYRSISLHRISISRRRHSIDRVDETIAVSSRTCADAIDGRVTGMRVYVILGGEGVAFFSLSLSLALSCITAPWRKTSKPQWFDSSSRSLKI